MLNILSTLSLLIAVGLILHMEHSSITRKSYINTCNCFRNRKFRLTVIAQIPFLRDLAGGQVTHIWIKL